MSAKLGDNQRSSRRPYLTSAVLREATWIVAPGGNSSEQRSGRTNVPAGHAAAPGNNG
jgi:hypothetical protein